MSLQEFVLLNFQRRRLLIGKGDFDEVVPTKEMNIEVSKYPNAKFDYTEILIKCIKILRLVSVKFEHVLVDEFQDVNLIMNEIVTLLVRDGASLTCLQDTKQDIYFFGADIKGDVSQKVISVFNPKIFSMKDNYRSHNNIVLGLRSLFRVVEYTSFLESKIPVEDCRIFVLHVEDVASQNRVTRELIRIYEGIDFSVSSLYRKNDGVKDLKKFIKKKDKKEETLTNMNEIQTIHASKGSEYHVISIGNCFDRNIPFWKTSFVNYQLGPTDTTQMKGEKNVFFEGLSRAMKIVYLIVPDTVQGCDYFKHFNVKKVRPSSFLPLLTKYATNVYCSEREVINMIRKHSKALQSNKKL